MRQVILLSSNFRRKLCSKWTNQTQAICCRNARKEQGNDRCHTTTAQLSDQAVVPCQLCLQNGQILRQHLLCLGKVCVQSNMTVQDMSSFLWRQAVSAQVNLQRPFGGQTELSAEQFDPAISWFVRVLFRSWLCDSPVLPENNSHHPSTSGRMAWRTKCFTTMTFVWGVRRLVDASC